MDHESDKSGPSIPPPSGHVRDPTLGIMETLLNVGWDLVWWGGILIVGVALFIAGEGWWKPAGVGILILAIWRLTTALPRALRGMRADVQFIESQRNRRQI